jgi:Lon protease-like protein
MALPRVYRKPSELPVAIPVFPLGGALLFPKAVLPLNIFEPRYLAMVDAALVGHRLIGMIQPAGIVSPATPSDTDSPSLAEVGCAGRITGFQETEDGRYLIALTGITRFRVREEIKHDGAYRIVRADWDTFAPDLDRQPALDESARLRLIDALKTYLERGAMKADWGAVEEAPVDTLINSLSAGCPFTNPEKQALLEARTLEDRCAALISLLQMERPGQGGGYVQ